jgi:hypothetical protein
VIAVITLEGVLAAGVDLRSAPPTKWAKQLYDAMHSQFRVIGLTVADPELAKWWTKREMLYDWAGIMSHEEYLEYPSWKVEQIRSFLAEGWEVACYLDTDPIVLSAVNELGVLTMSVAPPSSRVGFRPHEEAPRPWSEVAGTL